MEETRLTKEILAKLAEPFDPAKIGLKVQTKPNSNGKVMVVCYIDARDVATRLNEAAGGDWHDEYRNPPTVLNSGLQCDLTVCGVTRIDVGASDNDNETEKSAYSDAFKRAAVKFGVGAYLYDLPKFYATPKQVGNNYYLPREEEDRIRGELAAKLKAWPKGPTLGLREKKAGTKSEQTQPATDPVDDDSDAEGLQEAAKEQQQEQKQDAPVAKLTDVQRMKIVELYRALNGSDLLSAGRAVEQYFLQAYGHDSHAASHEEGYRYIAELQTEIQRQADEFKTKPAESVTQPPVQAVQATDETPAPHWIDDPGKRRFFWQKVSTFKINGRTPAQDKVCEILGTRTVHEYTGTMEQALATLEERINSLTKQAA